MSQSGLNYYNQKADDYASTQVTSTTTQHNIELAAIAVSIAQTPANHPLSTTLLNRQTKLISNLKGNITDPR